MFWRKKGLLPFDCYFINELKLSWIATFYSHPSLGSLGPCSICSSNKSSSLCLCSLFMFEFIWKKERKRKRFVWMCRVPLVMYLSNLRYLCTYIRNENRFAVSSVDIRIRYDATHAIDVNINRSRLNLFECQCFQCAPPTWKWQFPTTKLPKP